MSVGVVVVGRNEAARLERCLRSAQASCDALVYVDSGSSDDSVALARSLGLRVVELDDSKPFTAARGRNAGFEALCTQWPDVDRVQFVDGDCELDPGWVVAACEYLDAHPDVAITAGRRREISPESSRYNLLTDMEWNTPVGDAEAVGGDLMVRREAFVQAGGYDPKLIAGEDPDFCFRVRASGARIVRLDHEMTRHDAAILHFDQWWRRQTRSGHAYAELALRHGRFRARQVASILGWGVALPAFALVGAPLTAGLSLLALSAYGFLWLRVRGQRRRRGDSREAAGQYASACVLGKFAGAYGIATFAWNRWLRDRDTGLIEYKL